MTRALCLLGALVLVLAAWNALLVARATRTREQGSRVGTLFTAEEAEMLRKLPALRIEMEGNTHAYGRVQGEWRCLSLHQAPVDGRAVQSLIDGLLRAEGLVHARAVDEAPAYGINTPTTVRVSLQGPRATEEPGGDVRATIEIGKSQPGRDACFVRRKGTREIWAVAGDLGAAFATRVAPGLPPLLAPAAVPAAWLERGGGTSSIEVRHSRGDSPTRFTLHRREQPPDPTRAQPGDLPWSWTIDQGAGEHELAPSVLAAYLEHLEHLPYMGVLDPATRGDLGVEAPLASITLRPRAGPELVLACGQSDAAGRVALWVPAIQALYQIDAATFALAAPEAAELLGADEANDPWSAALRPKER